METRYPFTMTVQNRHTGATVAIPVMCPSRDLSAATAEVRDMFESDTYAVTHVAPRESAQLAQAGLCDWNAEDDGAVRTL